MQRGQTSGVSEEASSDGDVTPGMSDSAATAHLYSVCINTCVYGRIWTDTDRYGRVRTDAYNQILDICHAVINSGSSVYLVNVVL